jgi:N-formylglutamate amidohydrolase
MVAENHEQRDSFASKGGEIPGAAGQSAFTLTRPDPSPIPIIIAAPHAGRNYPPGVVESMRNPSHSALKLEDRFVDLVAAAVARETGAALLIAHAPRAMIDLNRAEDEMDWDMLLHGPPPGRSNSHIARRARGGLGLVPRRLPDIGEIWNRRIEESELSARIENIHRPYHCALADCMDHLRARWGAALLIDMHSMPPLSPRITGESPPRFVIGDRFGATCDGTLCAAAFDEFTRLHQRAAHNRPYAGGYVLNRHSSPGRGLHAVQLEICRTSYLDSRLAEPGPGLERISEILSSLVRRMAAEVAALGRLGQLPQAAE